MGVIKESIEKEYDHLLTEAEDLLEKGGMSAGVASEFVDTMVSKKRNHFRPSKFSHVLDSGDYKKAGQMFQRAEKHDSNNYNREELAGEDPYYLGAALHKINEYVRHVR